MMCSRPTLALTATLLAAVLHAPPASAQQLESQIQELETRVQAGRSEMLHLIAPEHFAEAEERVNEARRRYDEGGNIGDIRSDLGDAREALGRAEELREMGELILRDALSARSAALVANAPEFSPEAWSDAEGRIRNAGGEIEEGDQNEARSEAAMAVERYQRAELLAIRRDVLGYTRELRDEARDRDAHEKARRTFARGDSLLAEAERILQEDRYQQGEATRTARAAAEAYQNATRIAGLVDQVREDDERAVEALVLRYDAQLQRIADALSFTASFHQGPEPVAEESVTAIESLYEQRTSLQEDVREREERIAALQARTDTVEMRLGRLADSLGARAEMEASRRRETTARLRERQERERRVERVRNLFPSSEAEVLLRGSELIVRLVGLTFPVGSSEIRPENFSLLTRVQEALRQFPTRRSLTIAGHTDAQGHEDYNYALSVRRADAVRRYLVANMGIPRSTISAVGYGESQPVATNETREGRAQNRRIDVIIGLPPIQGG
ncbi:MAG: OmpA family protein [Gemmatimonadetes bacterium]|nr:OmpA family protein [Gemmatimonadota bacterium]NIR80723.1 OmpA family protein [Gemmatimonadota bacterium]NIT89529.1 OmpA family protein [Gemmatimonadota bacterium]NIU33322.1 OmpA family protein [Gemmatimonadota bacterium]NIU37612.1 OmpA family protein [Gemmatimonadota bacterium]